MFQEPRKKTPTTTSRAMLQETSKNATKTHLLSLLTPIDAHCSLLYTPQCHSTVAVSSSSAISTEMLFTTYTATTISTEQQVLPVDMTENVFPCSHNCPFRRLDSGHSRRRACILFLHSYRKRRAIATAPAPLPEARHAEEESQHGTNIAVAAAV
jgi:hypothetical protein